MKRVHKKAEFPDPPNYSISIAVCQEHLQSARDEYRQTKQTAVSQRETWLEELAAALATQGKTAKATITKTLKRAESQRRTFRKLKYLRQKFHAGSVTFVTQIGHDGIPRDITDKSGIEKVLIQTHENKYRQCERTPMMQPPLPEDFGIIGANALAASQVMQGQYEVPPGVDDQAGPVLQQFAMSDCAVAAQELNEGIPVHQWKTFWKSARETTASGPSVINFSVLKAGAHSDILAIFDATMTEIPMLS